MVSMMLTDLEGFAIGTEFSPPNLHGLSHREIGDHSPAVSLLFEAPEPFLDATRGRTDADVLLSGRDSVRDSRAGSGTAGRTRRIRGRSPAGWIGGRMARWAWRWDQNHRFYWFNAKGSSAGRRAARPAANTARKGFLTENAERKQVDLSFFPLWRQGEIHAARSKGQTLPALPLRRKAGREAQTG